MLDVQLALLGSPMRDEIPPPTEEPNLCSMLSEYPIPDGNGDHVLHFVNGGWELTVAETQPQGASVK